MGNLGIRHGLFAAFGASALLAVGSPQGAHTVVVSRSALAGAARGVPLGIAGAPDSLPKLTSAPWTV